MEKVLPLGYKLDRGKGLYYKSTNSLNILGISLKEEREYITGEELVELWQAYINYNSNNSITLNGPSNRHWPFNKDKIFKVIIGKKEDYYKVLIYSYYLSPPITHFLEREFSLNESELSILLKTYITEHLNAPYIKSLLKKHNPNISVSGTF